MKTKTDTSRPDSSSISVGGKLLRERLELEELVVDLLQRLVDNALIEADKAVMEALSAICLFFRVNYCGLLDVAADTRQIRVLKMGHREAPERDISGIDIVPMYPRAYDRVVEQEEPIILLHRKNFHP